MTTEPEVPMSAEERAVLREEMRKLSILGNIVDSFTYQTVMRCLVTIDAQDREYDRLNADYRAMHDNLTGEIAHQSGIIRSISLIVGHIGGSATLFQSVAALEARLREAEERVAYLERSFFTKGVRDALQHFYNRECGGMANREDITRAAAAILTHEQESAALQSAQKENE